jgi:hypothetical protein
MRGLITNADVLKNPLLICRQFGVGVLLRCLGAVLRSSKVTFLELAVRLESGRQSPRSIAPQNTDVDGFNEVAGVTPGQLLLMRGPSGPLINFARQSRTKR